MHNRDIRRLVKAIAKPLAHPCPNGAFLEAAGRRYRRAALLELDFSHKAPAVREWPRNGDIHTVSFRERRAGRQIRKFPPLDMAPSIPRLWSLLPRLSPPSDPSHAGLHAAPWTQQSKSPRGPCVCCPLAGGGSASELCTAASYAPFVSKISVSPYLLLSYVPHGCLTVSGVSGHLFSSVSCTRPQPP